MHGRLGRSGLAAVAVTGVLVGGSAGGSVLAAPDLARAADQREVRDAGWTGAEILQDRAEQTVSRGGERLALAGQDVSLDRQGAEQGSFGAAIAPAPTDPRDIARAMLPAYGWSAEFSCLDQLWIGESNWDHTATNPTSGAYGIPQSLPAEKMATAGSDWRTNPATQIEWGLAYIESSYGSPCAANSFKLANGWY